MNDRTNPRRKQRTLFQRAINGLSFVGLGILSLYLLGAIVVSLFTGGTSEKEPTASEPTTTQTATPTDGTPAPPTSEAPAPEHDILAGSHWNAYIDRDEAFFRFDADGTGILRVGATERHWQAFPLTWTRAKNGEPVKQGGTVTVTIPDAGKKGTIVVSGPHDTEETWPRWSGTDGQGNRIEVVLEAFPSDYIPVADNSLLDTKWVGKAHDDRIALFLFRADGTGEATFTEQGFSDSYDTTWQLDGSTVTVNVEDGTPEGATYTGTATPFGKTLTLTGTARDGATVSTTLTLADIKPPEED